MTNTDLSPDIVIVGSGLGGSIIASKLAATGASILILERGEPITPASEAISEHAILVESRFVAREQWFDHRGKAFRPWMYYNVGGNTKYFGAVLSRFRETDFEETELPGGISPAWPFRYTELEPFYCEAERILQVRGETGSDPCEPKRSCDYPLPASVDEASVAKIRSRLDRIGIKTFKTPLCVDIPSWAAQTRLPWDGYPNVSVSKSDAENSFLRPALSYSNVKVLSGSKVVRLDVNGNERRINRVEVDVRGENTSITPKYVFLCAGAINSAAILMRSESRDGKGLANSSGRVGRNLMAHHCSAVVAIDPLTRNDALYQKTVSFNDFYLSDGAGGKGLGHVQMLGKISEIAIQSMNYRIPRPVRKWIASHSVDWFAISEDLPNLQSGVTVRSNGQIHLEWYRPNQIGHNLLLKKLRKVFREAGYPLTFFKQWDIHHLTHQCGTVCIGNNPATAPLDPLCKSYDLENLWVVDASFLPTSSAVNPSLTVAAQALRVGDYLRHNLR
ncbi:GMC family oxidoreductase [Ensifer sp. SSB1]|uniref:GMC oxidoreductase n=1 Tax=Ensifer sp. SSB1 TaxID=2795385 RepID=UPI001A43B99C|nr:GMC family oxidoreductase [Ensifer sp. SSB1]MBK5567093.1 GMC family oxidoreductase [Ensifer sp. SSB1]